MHKMKKVLFIALMAFFSLNAHAQLNVTEEIKDSEKISTYYVPGYSGAAQLMRSASGLYYYIDLWSSNRFDSVFSFFIGKTKEEAMQTLLDLEALYKMKKNTTIVVQNHKAECHVRIINGSRLLLFQDGYAGSMPLKKGAVQKFILDIGAH